jgi:sugar O-acyltransferase (sialic acid O-acetyltransferase NeuD family)
VTAPATLLLVAASGLAREVLAVVRASAAHEVVGILDDDVERRGTLVDGVRVLGGIEEVKEHPGAALVLCVGRGRGRERLAARLAALGAGEGRYATVVHPTVEVPPGCEVGAGSILLAGVVLTANVRVGRHVVVMPKAVLTHDDVLDDFATVCAGVALGGGVQVGRGAYLGMNASVREGVVVGARATLGMGAVLLTDLPAGQTWAGVPARPVRSGSGTSARP